MVKFITRATAKKVLWEMYRTGKDPIAIIEEQDLWELDFAETERVVDEVIRNNPEAVAQYRRINASN